MTRTLVQASLFAFVLASASTALAQDQQPQQQGGGGGDINAGAVFTSEPEPQNASNHPLSVYLGLGASVAFNNGGGASFKLTEGLDYHFSGTDEGFHAGLMLGEWFPPSGFGMQIAARAGWDFKFNIGSNLFLGVDPFLALGGSFVSGGGMTFGWFDLEPGVDVKLHIGDMFYVLLRPLAFEIFIGDGGGASYDLMVGAGIRL